MPHDHNLISQFTSYAENTMNSVVVNSVGKVLLQLKENYFPSEEAEELISKETQRCINELETLQLLNEDKDLAEAITFILSLVKEPIHPQLDTVTLYLPHDGHYKKETIIFPLAEVLMLVWKAINDVKPYTWAYDGDEKQRSMQALLDQKNRLNTFYNCLKDLNEKRVCHVGNRNDLVFLLNGTYQGIEIIEDLRSTVHAYLKEQIITTFWKKYLTSEEKSSLNRALLEWMETNDVTKLITYLNFDSDNVVVFFEEKLLQQGSKPRHSYLKVLIDEALSTLTFSCDAKQYPLLDKIAYIQNQVLLNNEEKRNSALQEMRELLQRNCDNFAAIEKEILAFHCNLEFANNFKKYKFLLSTYDLFSDFAALAARCNDNFNAFQQGNYDLDLGALLGEKIKLDYAIAQCLQSMWASPDNIENFCVRWFTAKCPYGLNDNIKELRKLYLIFISEDFKKKVVLRDDEIARLMSSQQTGEINLQVFDINRTFLHAVIITPDQWTEVFSEWFNEVLLWVKKHNSNEQGDFILNTVIRDSYPEHFITQLRYLQKWRKKPSNKYWCRPEEQMLLLPQHPEHIDELVMVIEILGVKQFKTYFNQYAVKYQKLFWEELSKYIRLSSISNAFNRIPVVFWQDLFANKTEKFAKCIGNIRNLDEILGKIFETGRLFFFELLIKNNYFKNHYNHPTIYPLIDCLKTIPIEQRARLLLALNMETKKLNELIMGLPSNKNPSQKVLLILAKFLEIFPMSEWRAVLKHLNIELCQWYWFEVEQAEKEFITQEQKDFFKELTCRDKLKQIEGEESIQASILIVDPPLKIKVMQGINNFEKFLKEKFPVEASHNDEFIQQARHLCDSHFNSKNNSQSENREELVCEQIYNLAKTYFPADKLLILIDLIFVPIGLALVGVPLFIKSYYTGSLTFFGALTPQQKELGACLEYQEKSLFSCCSIIKN